MASRIVEVFTAGCPCCDDAVAAVRAASCSNCEVQIKDMKDPAVAAEARRYGIARVPAIVIDGKLADCCAAGGVDIAALRAMGLGRP